MGFWKWLLSHAAWDIPFEFAQGLFVTEGEGGWKVTTIAWAWVAFGLVGVVVFLRYVYRVVISRLNVSRDSNRESNDDPEVDWVPPPIERGEDVPEEEEEPKWCPVTLNEIADLIENRPDITTREQEDIFAAFNPYWFRVEGTVMDASSWSVDIEMEDGFRVTLYFDYDDCPAPRKGAHFAADGQFRMVSTTFYRQASLENCRVVAAGTK